MPKPRAKAEKRKPLLMRGPASLPSRLGTKAQPFQTRRAVVPRDLVADASLPIPPLLQSRLAEAAREQGLSIRDHIAELLRRHAKYLRPGADEIAVTGGDARGRGDARSSRGRGVRSLRKPTPKPPVFKVGGTYLEVESATPVTIVDCEMGRSGLTGRFIVESADGSRVRWRRVRDARELVPGEVVSVLHDVSSAELARPAAVPRTLPPAPAESSASPKRMPALPTEAAHAGSTQTGDTSWIWGDGP